MTTNHQGGWPFPPSFALDECTDLAGTSSIALVNGDVGISQSICVLLQTQPGERVMRPTYGCDLESAMFANIDDGLLAHVESLIYESITTFEPRAQALQVTVSKDANHDGRLQINIMYQHVDTGFMGTLRGLLNVVEGLRVAF